MQYLSAQWDRRHSEIEFRLLKFIYSEKALLSNNYIFANFGIKPTLIWYCLVGQTVYLSSFKHLSSKHCNLFYILEIYMRICNWPWLIVNALFLDDLGNATGKNIGLAISKLVYLKKKKCKNVMIGKRFFVNWLHIFKMKKTSPCGKW